MTPPSPALPTGAGAAGCSGKTLAQKLGVKARQQVLLVGAPAGWELAELPEGASLNTAADEADVVVAFFRSAAELVEQGQRLAQLVKPRGSLWVAWPRRAGGHSSDLSDNFLREVLLPIGLVDVKVAAFDRDWSGLKFVWRRQTRL
ncbi:MAG TPA: DUF3052 domain-containing protein [Acidimicrobiales bacterium]|nr:DUF3052 domain-containing protein [Acidimicrobiales bacterium]